MKNLGTLVYNSNRQVLNDYFQNSSDEDEDENPEEEGDNEQQLELNGEDFKYDCDDEQELEDHQDNIGNSDRQGQKVIQLKNGSLGISVSGQTGQLFAAPRIEQTAPLFSSRSALANENQSCNNSQMSLHNPQIDLSFPMGSLEKLHGDKKSSMRQIHHNGQDDNVGEKEFQEKINYDKISSEQGVSWREYHSGNKNNIAQKENNSEEKPTGENSNFKQTCRYPEKANFQNIESRISDQQIQKKQLLPNEEIRNAHFKKDQIKRLKQKMNAIDLGGNRQVKKGLKNTSQGFSIAQKQVIKGELLVIWVAQILLGIGLLFVQICEDTCEKLGIVKKSQNQWEFWRACLLITVGLVETFLSFLSQKSSQSVVGLTRTSTDHQISSQSGIMYFPCYFQPQSIKQIYIFTGCLSFILILEQNEPEVSVIQVCFAFIQLLVVHKLAASACIYTFLSYIFPSILLTYALLRKILDHEALFIAIEVILYLSIVFSLYKMRIFASSPFLFEGVLHRNQQVLLQNAGAANNLSTGSYQEDGNISCKRISREKSSHSVADQQNQNEIFSKNASSPEDNSKDKNKRIKKVYQDILNVIPEGVALINSSNKLVYANKTLQNILSCQKNQIIATLMTLATKPQNEENKQTHKATSLPQQQHSSEPQLKSFHSLNYPISSKNNNNNSNTNYQNNNTNNNEDFQSSKQHQSLAPSYQTPSNGMTFNCNSNYNNINTVNYANCSLNNSQQFQFSSNSPQSLTKLIDPPNSTQNQNDLKGSKQGSKPSLFHRNQISSISKEEGEMLVEEQQVNKNIKKRFSLPLNGNFRGIEVDSKKVNNTLHEDKKNVPMKLPDEDEVDEENISIEKQNPSTNNGNHFNNNGSSHINVQLNTVNPQTIASKRTNEFSDMISLTNYIQNYNIGNGVHYQNNNFLKDNNNNNNIINNNNFNITDSVYLNDQGKSLNLGQRMEEEFDFVRQRKTTKFKNTEITRKDINVKEILYSIFENMRQAYQDQDQDTKTAKTFKFSKEQPNMNLNSSSATKIKINSMQQQPQIQHSNTLQPGQSNQSAFQHQQSLSHQQATQPPQRQGSFLTQMKNQNNIGCFQQIDDMIKVEVEYRNSTLVLSMVMCEIVTNGFTEQLALILVDPIWQEMYEKKVQDMNNYRMKMFASLSHELRTPLNCSISMLQQLKNIINDSSKQIGKENSTSAALSIKERIQAKLNQKNNIEIKSNSFQASSKEQEEKTKGYITEYIDPALNSNNLLLNLINDILDFVQIDSGKFKFTFVNFDLEQLLSNCVSMVGIQSKQNSRNVELSLKYDDKCPKIINSDPNRIRQVVLNFLSNSLKFTPVGQITLSATLVNSKERSKQFSIQELHHHGEFGSIVDEEIANSSQNIIEIAVEDQGIGISQEDIDKIFTIFNKVNLGNAQQLNTQGCGLGLTISNSIAKGLGPFNKGGVRVHSQKGQGSVFSIFVEDKLPEIDQKNDNPKEDFGQIKKMQTIKSQLDSPTSQKTCIPYGSLPFSQIQALDLQYAQQPSLHYLGYPQIMKSEESQQIGLSFSNMTNKTCKTGRSIKRQVSYDSCCVLDTEHNQQQIPNLSPSVPFEQRNLDTFNFPSRFKTESENEQEDDNEEEDESEEQEECNNNINQAQQQNNRLDFITSGNTSDHNNKKPFFNQTSKKSQITYNTKTFHKITSEQKDNSNAKSDAYISYNSIKSLKRIKTKSNLSPTHVSIKKIPHSPSPSTSQTDQINFLSPPQNEQSQKQSTTPRQFLSKSQSLQKKAGSEPVDNQNSQDTGLQSQKQAKTSLELQNILGSSERDLPILKEVNSQFSKTNEDQEEDEEDESESNSKKQRKLDTSLELRTPPQKCECPQVLVVDDNHFNIYAIAMQLKTYGFKVDQGFNGQEAVDIVKRRFLTNKCCRIFKLIFMDIEMPVKNGYSAAEEIRDFLKKEHYTGKQPIIIACTAYVSDEDNQKAINHGMDDFIKKPVFQEGLEQLLEDWYSEIFEENDENNNIKQPSHHYRLSHDSQLANFPLEIPQKKPLEQLFK